jgi:ABC-type transport system involved in cytochrome bd biosynthesis fused ATPase/permease subunit
MKTVAVTLIVSLAVFLLSTSSSSANTINFKKFKTKQALCQYIEEQKEAAEDRMTKGYKASQYDALEATRKYWKNLYVDKCF